MTTNLINSTTENTCNQLGFLNDEKTAMDYPSSHNYCHQCEPPNTPGYSHQRMFCLSQNFTNCPVFASTKIGPMPKEIALVKPAKRSASKKKVVWLLVIILIVLGLVGLWLLLPQLGVNIPSMGYAASMPSATPLASIGKITATVTMTEEPTATEALPTATATVPVPRLLETPFGLNMQFVVHQVKEGENLTALAKIYSTSVEAIKAVNVLENTLQVNSLLVIPVDSVDVSGTPKILVAIVDEPTTTLLDIANEYNLDPGQLSQLNQLPENTVFILGDWVLIPAVGARP